MQSRSEALQAIQNQEFDVAVIGGGIVGVGIAQNAAVRGLSVVLVEKADFASGTSSKTTKLIHGGLRYLEQLHFRLTRELCHERALLETLAPQLVKDFSFILPIGEDSRFFSLKAQAGLTLYDLLAMNTSNRRHHRLSQKEVIGAAPSLSSKKVVGGLRFHDCITDDSRLVLEVLKSACHRGAFAANYLEARNFDLDGGRITKIHCRDRYSGADVSISCKTVVNATGVWSDELVKKVDPSWGTHVAPAKGVHIMLPHSAFETSTALFLPTKDGRYVFVVPWQKALMIGTTDTLFEGSLDSPLPNEDEISYLLNVVNSYSRETLNRSDVIAAWAGLRPLVGGDTASKDVATSQKSTANLSREHELFEGPGGMVGLIGGKLTNYRILSQHVVDKIVGKLPTEVVSRMVPAITNEIMLGGWNDKDDYLTTTAEISAKARKLGVEPATLDHILASYGRDSLRILEHIERDPALNKRICPDFPPIMAEVAFTVRHEMALSLEDILFRRIRLALVHQEQTMQAAPKVARLVQGLTGWDEARTTAELRNLETALSEHMVFKVKTAAAEEAR